MSDTLYESDAPIFRAFTENPDGGIEMVFPEHFLTRVPINQGASLNLEWAEEQYRKNGFIHIKRVPERYWQRNDIRKFLSPVHFDRDNILTKLFYGDGHLKMIGTKV